MTRDEKFMLLAMEQAKKAAAIGEAPIGAVVVRGDEVIAAAYNTRETEKNALHHAEIEAINMAFTVLKGWRLIGCDMYVTLEPCPMCSGAIVNSRIRKLYFGAYDNNYGCCGSNGNILTLKNSYHPEYEGGILHDECKSLLQEFFKKLR